MQRIIKYRGKVDGVWWYVSPDHNPGLFGSFWHVVDRDTVGQLVATNKAGKDIYENDIVRLPNTDRCLIEYKDTMFVATSITKKFRGCDKYIYWHSGAEIIGNIHDNPTLLSKQLLKRKEQ